MCIPQETIRQASVSAIHDVAAQSAVYQDTLVHAARMQLLNELMDKLEGNEAALDTISAMIDAEQAKGE